MDPLVNALLGVLFVGVGAVATAAMYFLRGRPVGPGSRRGRRATGEDAAAADGEIEAEYLAAWRRPADEPANDWE